MKVDANDVKGAMSNLNSKMDMRVQHLKDEIGKEGIERQ